MRDEDLHHEAPGPVIGAVALGVAPLPFLVVYSILFIGHGFIYPTQPVDITTTQTGEGIAGIIAVLLAIVGVITVFWLLSGTRRWPFLVSQAATLAAAVDFIVDVTKGSRGVPSLLVLTSVLALVLALLPSSSAYLAVRRRQLKGTAAVESHNRDRSGVSA